MDGMTANIVQSLTATMREEIRLQSDFLELVRAKRTSLVGSDVARVEEIVRREEKSILPIGEAGMRRMKLTEQLGKVFGLQESNVSIANIAKRIPDPHKTELLRLSSQLKKLIAEVGAYNKTNKMLAEQAILQTRDFLRILSGQGETESVYTRKGLTPPKQVYRVAIDRVA